MRRALLVVVLLACVAPAVAADEASEVDRLTADNLRLRQELVVLRPEVERLRKWMAIYEAGVYTTALNGPQQQALAQEANAIEQGWKALEASRRKALTPKDGSTFNRQTLEFDPPKEASK